MLNGDVGRLEALEDWQEKTQDRLEHDIPLILGGISHLKSLCATIANKLEVIDREATRAADTAMEAKQLAEQALARGDSVPPKMREKLSSYSTEIEEVVRGAKDEIKQLSRNAAASSDPKAVEGMITKFFETKELTSFRSWKTNITTLAQKISWALAAAAGAGLFEALSHWLKH